MKKKTADLDVGGMGRFARIDHTRVERCGFPEFVYGEKKSCDQLRQIVAEIIASGQPALVTRLSEEKWKKLKKSVPPAAVYDPLAQTLTVRTGKTPPATGLVLVVTAGTSDIPVAMEATRTAELCGCGTETIFDVGVAGIHRLLSEEKRLKTADVIIAVAGMEGALPSVIAGLVPCPVIAVPTSVGYGSSLNGLVALFAMLNSCANGVTVMNIDNGFGAGCAAARIINRRQ